MKWYNNEDFVRSCVKGSVSYSQILRKIGIRDVGSNYNTLKKAINKYSIGFKPIRSELNTFEEIPIECVLVENSTYGSTNRLKKRLIKLGYFVKKCYRCNRKRWLRKEIPLQLEHIDGNRINNKIDNLTLLCPNCHAQTPTYCRGSKKYKESMKEKEKIIRNRVLRNKRIFEDTKRKKKQMEYINNKIKEDRKKAKKKILNFRLSSISSVDLKKYGWVQKLSILWGVSHTQVRRFLKRTKPEIYIEAMNRSNIGDVV